MQHGPLSARGELQSHPLAGQAQACGRATQVDGPGGPMAPVVATGWYHCSKKKLTTFLDSCMSSLRLSMLFFSVSLKRIMFVIPTQGPCSPVLVLTWRSSYADTVGEGVNKLARAQANVPSRFQSRVQHANSIRLSDTVVYHRSSTIS